MKSIAVLLTCYNRKEKTLRCLDSLYASIKDKYSNFDFDIYLVDDHSNDGTLNEVSLKFPKVNLICGSGNLFWAGGMCLAWNKAIQVKKYNGYLLLNDDVELIDDFFSAIVITDEYCRKNFNSSGIYVCTTKSKINQAITYGGKVIIRKNIKIFTKTVVPQNRPLKCDMANANILYISSEVVNKIGIFDQTYTHGIADYDYTLTATKQKIPVYVCPDIGGFCEDDHPPNWLSGNASLKERIKYLNSPKGLAYKEYLCYLKKHFYFQAPYYIIMFWLKTFFPVLWNWFKVRS